MKLLLVAVCFTTLCFVYADLGCWRTTYGRGVGKVITACSDDEEKNGALCYPKCKDGYYGVGPVFITACSDDEEKNGALCYPKCKDGYYGVGPVCWQKCPDEYTDIGVGCQKPSSYGRGAGYISDDRCQGHSDTGCEKWGLLWYPKCKYGFHNVACCVCSPDCPAGFTDSGVTCTKDSYGRGAGKPLKCASGLVEDDALCYKACADSYNGVGPVCWHQCPPNLTSCGALCLTSTKECIKDILSIAEDVATTAAAIAADPEHAVDALKKAVLKIGSELLYPLCPNIS
uniref:Uncharacterized protein n=1 Tax=Panagrolaimus sp. ES5 TaxID=591445 RepID=A0AC34FP00_9BILA